ncbi:unnamed protein product [Vitrella brassicaformis CCMP3155]|uniref:Uncharacterized protein n=1 Tax=Vitrella brassicaformis (strain CCMP3155) TaxID=1169540 RepID=A0A0G4G8Y5_VITBC|nr:unnamed protein product [Vitrella brassicaformis CCMP3155]|eukprot:CEM25323.1 unnamed protein product [Vitrella brassicaformis CCMP3155]
MEGDRQVKRTRRGDDAPAAAATSSASSSAAAASGGGGGSESGGERQRRAERERALCEKISGTEGLLSYMMALLPIHLMVQLAKSIWQHAAPHLSDVTISSATKEERSFWQHVHLAFVTQLAARLRRLTTITLRYPIGAADWCFDVFVAIIEGHIAGRRAANLGRGTLQTITMQGLASRRWLIPSLTTAQQRGWDAGSLGQFISSSRSLRRVDGSFGGEDWAGVFEGIPAAPAGQQGGPLAQLESIGTIEIDDNEAAGIDRLQEVLVARGCRRSLTQLHVDFAAHLRIGDINVIGRRTLPVLLALDRLLTTCCRPDAPLTLTTTSCLEFDLSIFYHNAFPTHPSPSFKTMTQQLARQATSVEYLFTQDGLTDPHTDPSQSAIDIASTLSFDEATDVRVENARGFHPPANIPSPHPTIITHLKPFPKASRLHVWSDFGGAAGQLMAAKMPEEVRVVSVLGGVERVGVLTALGREREVSEVEMGKVDVDQLDQLLLGAADSLPTISGLHFAMTLPADVNEAGSFVRARLSSVIPHIRGLQGVTLRVQKTTAEQHDSILASLPVGANVGGFSVRSTFGSAGVWTRIAAVRTPEADGLVV